MTARDHTGAPSLPTTDALEPDAPEGPAKGAEPRRGWPLQWYFTLLVALFVAAAAAAAVYVHAQAGRDAQLTIIAIGLVAVLLAALLVYRGIARPIEQLGSAVRSAGGHTPPVPVSASGPAEVTALAGEINALISTVGRQLTERHRAEEALSSSEESYRHLFEHHPSPLWLFDKETLRFLTVNAAAIATYGYSREEFLELTIADIRPPEDREGLDELVASLPDERVDVVLVRHTKKDGTVIDVAVSSSTTNFEGRPARLVLALDMTEQRRVEEQLRQTQKMEAIGNLAGAVAHGLQQRADGDPHLQRPLAEPAH